MVSRETKATKQQEFQYYMGGREKTMQPGGRGEAEAGGTFSIKLKGRKKAGGEFPSSLIEQ